MHIVRRLRHNLFGITFGDGTPLGPGGDYAFSVLWFDGSTSLSFDDELVW